MWITRTVLAIAVVTLAGLGCGAKATRPPEPIEPAPPEPIEPAPPEPMDLSGLGQACGEGGTCQLGQCARYFGIAGPSGPEFTSCELRCDAGASCPDGTSCITIADGPGEVCRSPESAAAEAEAKALGD